MLERTLVLLKPDAVERQLVGRILGLYEEKVCRLRHENVKPSRELVEAHYAEHETSLLQIGDLSDQGMFMRLL